MAAGAGLVTISAGVTMPNAPLAPLAVAGPFAVTRIFAFAVSGPVATQARLPVFGAAAASVSNVAAAVPTELDQHGGAGREVVGPGDRQGSPRRRRSFQRSAPSP